MLVYIVFGFFLLLMILGYFQKSWRAGIYIVGVYALSAYFSILLLNSNSTYYRPTLEPTIIYCVLLFLAFKPFLRKEPVITGFSSLQVQRRFIIVGYILSAIVILGMVLILPKLEFALNYGLVDMRTDMYRGEEADFSNYGSLFRFGNLIVGYIGRLWCMFLMMFFYALIFIQGNFLLKYLLIISSTCQILVGMIVGGRTEALYWILSFGFSLVLFYPYFKRKTKIYFVTTSLILLAFVIFYVGYITFQRSIDREGGLNYFIYDYIGQSFPYFCEFYDKCDFHPYTLKRIFPFTSWLLGTDFSLQDYRDFITIKTGLDIGIFYTFMGDIFVDIGLIGLLIYIYVYYKLSSLVLKQDLFDIERLSYLSIFYVIPLHGVFFYSAWKGGVTFGFILTIIIARYIKTGFLK